MEIKTILWPTDLSANSIKAAAHVVDLAQKHDAAVVLLYVAVDLCQMFPAYGSYPSVEHLNNFRDWEIERARKRMEKICDEDLKACPYLRLRLVNGDPAAEILKFATREKADLIVMATRGEGQGTGLGDVARQVIEKAQIPVQMVNP
jgi:nucleotide-binding universal stress UspA family protein